jgi:hypothetical protein
MWMIGSLMMCVGAVVLVLGMLAGIDMGIREDFALASAHAHLNLIGGVLLFLFGLFYRVVPAAGSTALAKLQGWLHIVGAIVFPVGVGLVILSRAGIAPYSRRWVARRPPQSLFKPIRGIVRRTDSLRHGARNT